MCRCGCYEGSHRNRHGEWSGHCGYRMGWDFPLMSIEEEVEALEETKATLEKRLETVNKRLEVLKR